MSLPKLSQPPRPERQGSFGLPPIPDDILDVAVKYLPWIVLVGSFMNGATAAGLFITATSGAPGATSPTTVFGVFVSLLASVVGVAAFFWLSDKRQLGWFLFIGALGLQFLSSLIISGGASLLGGLLGLLVTAYVVMELRSAYTD